jgi:hypothetical protein
MQHDRGLMQCDHRPFSISRNPDFMERSAFRDTLERSPNQLRHIVSCQPINLNIPMAKEDKKL